MADYSVFAERMERLRRVIAAMSEEEFQAITRGAMGVILAWVICHTNGIAIEEYWKTQDMDEVEAAFTVYRRLAIRATPFEIAAVVQDIQMERGQLANLYPNFET